MLDNIKKTHNHRIQLAETANCNFDSQATRIKLFSNLNVQCIVDFGN